VIVIINSGPLMALAKLGLLDLLPRLYGQVIFPTAVFTEVVGRGRERGYSDAFLVQMAIQQGKLKVIEVNDVDLPSDIATLPLDAGEKQALYLAQRDMADLVLFDDEKVREEAKARGLNVKGTLGVIIQACRAGLLGLNDVQSIIEAIMRTEDIWISEELCRRVLLKLETGDKETK
jgi:predicted nucleic acid-binding protein